MSRPDPQYRPAQRSLCEATGRAQLTHAEAARAARVIRRRERNRGTAGWPITEYLCRCGWWHVGWRSVEQLPGRRPPGKRRAAEPRPVTPDGYERLGLPPPG